MVTAATRSRTNKPAAAKAEAPAPDAPETDAQKRNRLRNEAERHILNLHKDEFDDYAEALFSKNGLTFNRRLSDAQKAEKKINDLIAQHPELEAVLRAQFAAPAPTDAGAPAADPEWEARKQAVTQIAAADGVHLVDGVNPVLLAEEYSHHDAPEVDYSADEEGYVDPFAHQQ